MKSEGPDNGLEATNLVLGICLACAAFMFQRTSRGMEFWDRRLADCDLLRGRTLPLWRLGRMVESHSELLGGRETDRLSQV